MTRLVGGVTDSVAVGDSERVIEADSERVGEVETDRVTEADSERVGEPETDRVTETEGEREGDSERVGEGIDRDEEVTETDRDCVLVTEGLRERVGLDKGGIPIVPRKL